MEKVVLNFGLSSDNIRYKELLNNCYLELEMYAISDQNPNRNKSHFTIESMKKAIERGEFYNKPILAFFKDGDFVSHDSRPAYDPEFENAYLDTSNGERILGWIRESDNVELVENDGDQWIKFTCVLCTRYCYQQVKKLLKDKNKKVSVEITVNEYYMDDGIMHILDFTLNGTTILGRRNGVPVREGIEGAHASIIADLGDSLYSQRQAVSFEYSQYNDASEIERKEEPSTMQEENVVITENVDLTNENATEENAECTANNECTETNECTANNECNGNCECGDASNNTEENSCQNNNEQGENACENCARYEEQISVIRAEYDATIANLNAQIVALQEANSSLSSENVSIIERYENKISEIQNKYSDYEAIKASLETANATIEERRRSDLKVFAEAKMKNRNISQDNYAEIIANCTNGKYASQEDLTRDIAYALYKNIDVETHDEQFSTEIVQVETKNTNTIGTTPAERIAARCRK